jgi:hypothetical protein
MICELCGQVPRHTERAWLGKEERKPDRKKKEEDQM